MRSINLHFTYFTYLLTPANPIHTMHSVFASKMPCVPARRRQHSAPVSCGLDYTKLDVFNGYEPSLANDLMHKPVLLHGTNCQDTSVRSLTTKFRKLRKKHLVSLAYNVHYFFFNFYVSVTFVLHPFSYRCTYKFTMTMMKYSLLVGIKNGIRPIKYSAPASQGVVPAPQNHKPAIALTLT